MIKQVHWLSLLAALTIGLSLLSLRPLRLEPQTAAAQPSIANTDLIPLPLGCGGGLPPGEAGSACCMFGYIFFDGRSVSGARITVRKAGGKPIVVWSGTGDSSSRPYYGLDLTRSPVSATVGDTIVITAEYSGHEHTVTHRVLAGGQQVDVVIPHAYPRDLSAESQIWKAAATSTASPRFNFPYAVAVDGSGKVFVADRDNARIQVFNNSGELLTQWGSLGGGRGQFARPRGIAVDSQGMVYVADTGNYRIQKFSSKGVWQGSWGDDTIFPGGVTSVAVDAADFVYTTDDHFVQKFDGAGERQQRWGEPDPETHAWQFDHPQGVAVAPDGTIYVADTNNHRIQQRAPDGTWTVWSLPEGQLSFPEGVALTADQDIYVTDVSHRIQQFSKEGAFRREIGGGPTQFRSPRGIATDRDGAIYVADSSNHRIQVLEPDRSTWRTWGAKGRDDEQFGTPRSVVVDSAGNIYVADEQNNRVQKFGPGGDWLQTYTAGLNRPWGLAVDSDRNLYVTNIGSGQVIKFNRGGGLSQSWEGPGASPGQFSQPLGIATDSAGNVYVADSSNRRIRKFTGTGEHILDWPVPSVDGIPGVPAGVTVDSTGHVYVTDYGNNQIWKFNDEGEERPFRHPQDPLNCRLAKPGELPVDRLGEPKGIVVDGLGNVYVIDRGYSRLLRFDAAGTCQAAWRDIGGGDGQFQRPEGIAIGADGALYIADTGNQRVQRLRPVAFDAPIATIVQATPRDVVQGNRIVLRGMGGASNVESGIDVYQWRLNDTVIATTAGAEVSSATWPTGSHRLTLRVTDTEGRVSAPVELTINVAPPAQNRWTFLLYLDGDAPGLAPYLNRDTDLGALHRLEHSATGSSVSVVALYDGPGSNDTVRYLQRPGGPLVPEAVPEANMGDSQTLASFVREGRRLAPAERYYLAIADHANGLDGIAWDMTSGPEERLTNAELREALVQATENGGQKIDVLHLDGCLMGLLENAYQAQGLVDYVISSQNLAWSAFAYDRYRDAVGPGTDARVLAQAIVELYAEQVGPFGSSYTIAALDGDQLNSAALAADRLARELQRFALVSETNRELLATLRGQVQAFDSTGDHVIGANDEYVDLYHWAELVRDRVDDGAVQGAAVALINTRAAVVVAEEHGVGVNPGQTLDVRHIGGISIYYPNQHQARIYGSYAREFSFAANTLWDEFLTAALAGLAFEPSEPPPRPVPPQPLVHRRYLPLVQR